VDDEQSEETARTAIEEILAALNGGANFEELADQRSDRPGNGGSLGVFRRGEMERPFEDAAFQLEPGGVSGIVRTSFGFHIVKLYEKRPAGIPRLEEIREGIDEAIFRQKKQKVIEQFLDRLLAKADVRDV
jgi:parvulin-like peptidyl-prolyl isomerase